jgi:hypothetical protein
MKNMQLRVIFLIVLALTVSGMVAAAGGPPADLPAFPPSLESYGDTDMGSIIGILVKPGPSGALQSDRISDLFVCHHPHLSHRAIHGHRTPVEP